MEKFKILNQDIIKLLAIITMTFNHIAHMLLTANSPYYLHFVHIGYFTAITMCYFFVEGYFYSKNKKKLLLRLLLFALLSQFPYMVMIQTIGLNVLFSFILCFLILFVLEKNIHFLLKVILIIFIFMLSFFVDWFFILPMGTILFYNVKKNKLNKLLAFIIYIAVSFFIFMLEYNFNIINSVLAIIPMLISLFIICFCYNGKRSEGIIKLNKYIFYIYYPLHLFILMFIKFSI